MGKSFLALARVSSREQEREGFSLDVQVDAFERYATREQGRIVKLFRIAETASKRDERRTFKEMMAYAKKHAGGLDGLLFYKVDRAARNLFDYVELERFEEEFGVPVIYITSPRRTLRPVACNAAFWPIWPRSTPNSKALMSAKD